MGEQACLRALTGAENFLHFLSLQFSTPMNPILRAVAVVTRAMMGRRVATMAPGTIAHRLFNPRAAQARSSPWSRREFGEECNEPPCFRRSGIVAVVCAVLAFLATIPVQVRATPIYESLAAFQLVPSSPAAGSLLLHSDGNYYGASFYGGAQDSGTIYKVTPAGVSSVVVNFNGTGGAVNGRFPNCKLVSVGGLIWGSTTKGGVSDRGTIFKLNPATGETVTLIEFIGNGTGPKGDNPQGGLAGDGAGNLWGVTFAGGSTDRGTIFKINMATGVMTTVLEFTGVSGVKGMNPLAGLVNDGVGNFWGTTQLGGASNAGTVFKVNIASGVLTPVVEFPSTGSTPRTPKSELVSDGAGNFWGTSYQGGAGNFGTIFKVNINTGTLTNVVEFTGTTGAALGNHPSPELASDGLGNFWGTCYQGGTGSPNSGTIFKVNIATGTLTTILSFATASAPGAENPSAGLTADGAGNFWGTTQGSFSSPGGTVFKINIGSGVLTFQTLFKNGLSDGLAGEPHNPLVTDNAGSLWGTTYAGPGTGPGTIFKVNPATGVATRVAVFNGTSERLGAGGLVDDGAGFFWGVTSQGGGTSKGSVFKVNATTGIVSTMATFTGTTGATKGSQPFAGLASDGLGFLWGSANGGGASSNGTIYKMNIATGAFALLAEFTGSSGAVPGTGPTAVLINDGAGNMWGTVRQGGTTGFGTIFKINATTGIFTNVITFTGTSGAAKGSTPWSGLTSDGAGNLWGTTSGGGSGGFGTVFKVNTTTGVLTTVVEFTGTSGAFRGTNPESALTLDGAGNFWGMTNVGGTSGLGTIFKVSPAGAFTSVFNLTGYGGAVPGQKPTFGGMYKHTDGHLYGTLPDGGFGGGGLVFRLRFGPTPVTLAATNVAAKTATLRGTLNPNGTLTAASFEYGTNPALASFQTIAAGNTTAGTAPEAVAAAPVNLVPGTTYYFRVVGLNGENANAQRGAILSFTTAPNTPPTLTLPSSPVIAEATSASGAAVTFTVTANDAEDGALTPVVSPSSGSTFPIGDTTVNVSATDSGSLSTNGSFVVRVRDTTAPVVATHVNVSITATSAAGATVTYAAAAATDAVGVTLITYSQNSGTLFSIGSTTVTVTARDAANNAGSGSFTVRVLPRIQDWRQQYFGTTDNTGDAADDADPDHDGITNLMEFGTGTDPTSGASGSSALQYTGTFAGNGIVAGAGQPVARFETIPFGVDYRALFVRRVDSVAAGLTYIVQFSPDMTTWTASAVTPAVLADNGTLQIVSVPYPFFIGGKKVRFFRIIVTIAP